MTEVRRPPEQLPVPATFVGLQGRLVLSDQRYLHPDTPVPADGIQFKSFAERNYLPFDNVSLYERREHWSTSETHGFDNQFTAWSDAVCTMMNREDNKEQVRRLTPLLNQIGIQSDTFSREHTQTLFQRYFAPGQPQGAGVKKYIQDVIASGTDLQESEEAITWLAGIFGEKSSDIITQLIHAELQVETAADRFGELLKSPTSNNKERVNDLTAAERALLLFIWDHGGIPEQEGEQEQNGEQYPILKHKAEIQSLLKDPNVHRIIISAGTGAGKTTQVPLMALEVMGRDEKIAVSQPRRLPTEDLAGRVAAELEEDVGGTVGFQHGEGRVIGGDTRGLFISEGSLLRKLARDPLLTEFNYVMVDEWHERHTDTDILLALLLKAQELRKQAIEQGRAVNGRQIKPLKVIVASATLDMEKIKRYLTDARTVEVEGRIFPITDLYEPDGSAPIPLENMPEKAAHYAKEMVKPGRNLIIFMPGERLIRETYNRIEALNLPNVRLRTLYGAMSQKDQDEAKRVDPNVISIIIASPIAETSLTIPKVDVISSGWVNLKTVQPDTGLEFLEEVPHSQKGILQQRGRTGRESPGTFRFLGTRQEFEQ